MLTRRRGIVLIVALLLVAVGAATASIVLALDGNDTPRHAASDPTAARLDDPRAGRVVRRRGRHRRAGGQLLRLPLVAGRAQQRVAGDHRRVPARVPAGPDRRRRGDRGARPRRADLRPAQGRHRGDGRDGTARHAAGVRGRARQQQQWRAGRRRYRSPRPCTRSATRFLISTLDEDANAGLPPGTAGLRRAAEAGAGEIVDLLTFRRARFAADQQARARRGDRGCAADLARRLAATRAAMDKGGYDLSGAVTAVAVEAAADDR